MWRDEESGTDHTLHRHYANNLARSLTPDPNGGLAGGPVGICGRPEASPYASWRYEIARYRGARNGTAPISAVPSYVRAGANRRYRAAGLDGEQCSGSLGCWLESGG
jgi:hypothetical protein